MGEVVVYVFKFLTRACNLKVYGLRVFSRLLNFKFTLFFKSIKTYTFLSMGF